MILLDSAELAVFDADGFVLVRSLIDTALIETLRARFECLYPILWRADGYRVPGI